MSMNTVPLLVVASSATVGGSMIVAMFLAVVVLISFARFRRRGKRLQECWVPSCVTDRPGVKCLSVNCPHAEVRLHEKWTSPRR